MKKLFSLANEIQIKIHAVSCTPHQIGKDLKNYISESSRGTLPCTSWEWCQFSSGLNKALAHGMLGAQPEVLVTSSCEANQPSLSWVEPHSIQVALGHLRASRITEYPSRWLPLPLPGAARGTSLCTMDWDQLLVTEWPVCWKCLVARERNLGTKLFSLIVNWPQGNFLKKST